MTAVLEYAPRFFPEPEVHGQQAGVEERDDAFDMPACVRQVREGNENAARTLMERLYPLVLKLVRAYLPRRTAEEDLVQTVFMKIFTNLNQYSGLVPIERWVCRITVNTCLNQLQKEKIRPEWRFSDLSENQQRFLEEQLPAPDAASPGDNALAAEIVVRLLRLLKPADRLVIQLLHMEQKTILEIAEMTGWNVPMIKVRAFRARNKLKKLLRDLEPAMKVAG
jgi:RNA polymerase sigma-70 factor (ECF subfamily)